MFVKKSVSDIFDENLDAYELWADMPSNRMCVDAMNKVYVDRDQFIEKLTWMVDTFEHPVLEISESKKKDNAAVVRVLKIILKDLLED